MGSQIPQGFTVTNVCTNSYNVNEPFHDYHNLQERIKEMGVDVPYGCMSDSYWEWIW